MTKDLHASTASFPYFVIFCDGLCNIETPTKLEERKSYIQVSGGAWHMQEHGHDCREAAVILCTHLRAIAFGENILTDDVLQYHALRRGEVIHQVCVSGVRTVLLRSDGCAVACGEHLYIPSLEDGQSCPHRFLQRILCFYEVMAVWLPEEQR